MWTRWGTTSQKDSYVTAGGSPTVRRRRLAAELRRLREAADLTCDEVGEQLEWSGSKVSRIETGRVGVRPRDVRDLLDIYGVTDERHRDALVRLAREARQKGWWTTYGDVMVESFLTYIGLEAEASAMRDFQIDLVPALVQTENYAQAVTFTFPGSTPDEIKHRVALRMGRQARLTGDNPLQFWAVVDESALRRQVGGGSIMQEQLHHLVQISELANVTIQVLPFTAGAHPSMGTSFVILQFPEPTDPDVVYLEGMTSGLYLERTEEITTYALSFDHLRTAALSPDESAAMITAVARELP